MLYTIEGPPFHLLKNYMLSVICVMYVVHVKHVSGTTSFTRLMFVQRLMRVARAAHVTHIIRPSPFFSLQTLCGVLCAFNIF